MLLHGRTGVKERDQTRSTENVNGRENRAPEHDESNGMKQLWISTPHTSLIQVAKFNARRYKAREIAMRHTFYRLTTLACMHACIHLNSNINSGVNDNIKKQKNVDTMRAHFI
jgi:hypothetical protein